MKRMYSLVAAGLSVSLFIYLFYRSRSTVINELFRLAISPERYTQLRISVTTAIPLNDAVIFSLPGGLWVFCMTLLSRDLYIKINQYELRMAPVPIVFSIGLELFQLFHVTRGTFDLWDVGSYALFWLLAYYGFQSRSAQQDILSPFTLKGFICLTCFLSVYLAHVNP
jgi:hypothetical protein